MKNSKAITAFVVLIILVAAVVFAKPFFIVQEGEQAVVLRFGRLVNSVTDAGLNFKLPVVDVVVKYPSKILSWDGRASEIATQEQQYIRVDTTARWRISDVELFYAQMQSIFEGYDILDNFIDSTVKTIIARNSLLEAVRSDDQIIGYIDEMLTEADDGIIMDVETDADFYVGLTDEKIYENITKGRQVISDDILKLANENTARYGMELVDVVVRQIRYAEQSESAVYERMIRDRAREAEGLRSFGMGQKAEWLGRLTREEQVILSTAQRTASEIKASADAEAASIYSAAFERDPEFFQFWRSLESYKMTMPNFQKTMTTELDYFRYLHNQN